MKHSFFKFGKIAHSVVSSVLVLSMLLPVTAYASPESDALEENRLLPVASNQVDNWPQGPTVGAYSALLMEAETGAILYDKNSDAKMFPASTTKLLTCMLAMEKENSNLNDLVSFSYDAVMTVPWDASNMGIDVGNKMTLEECLYGILVVSANEISNAVAEYVSGDIPTFVDLMNKRAKELGCINTHFTNPHGYTDPNHYTTAYDLALIGREFFKNELLAKISRTPNYHWYPTEYQPDDMALGSTNYFMKGRYICDGLIGSKTGYTDESRQVLITCAERGGIRLICVVMQDEMPYQYEDTLSLLDYGFSNFTKIRISDYDRKYIISEDNFINSESAVFGDPTPIFSMDKKKTIILPKNVSFDDLDSSLSFNSSNDDSIATVTYRYHGAYLGSTDILFTKKEEKAFVFDETDPEIIEDNDEEPTFIYINYIIYGVAIMFFAIFFIAILVKILSGIHFSGQNHLSRRQRRKRSYGKNYSLSAMDKPKKKKRGWKRKDSSYIDI